MFRLRDVAHHNGFAVIFQPHFLTKKKSAFQHSILSKMVVEDGNFNDIFYAQKIRNLHFLSSKISNSAHPVQKIQCLLNGFSILKQPAVNILPFSSFVKSKITSFAKIYRNRFRNNTNN